MKSLSDVVNDSEDCSGVISSTPVTVLFTAFSWREWLFGIWTNVNRQVNVIVHHISVKSSSSLFPCYFLPDTQTLEQCAENYTPEHVIQFLEEIGLSHHMAIFSDEEIDGDMLLESTDEILKELGVNSAVERLKIKVCRRGQGSSEYCCFN